MAKRKAAREIRVRMYRQGLGDCFLVSVLRGDAAAFHIMIDCGVLLGTPDGAAHLRTVVADIIATTGGQVDVLAVTHEHYDHVAAFKHAEDLFARPEAAGAPGKLTVKSVWFAWTENPASTLGQDLRRERGEQVEALARMALRLGADGASQAPQVGQALSFFGVGADGKGATREAMENAARLAPPGAVHYHEPGTVLSPDGAPELRVHVLGPPMDRKSLMRLQSATATFHAHDGGLAESVRLAASGPAAPGEWDWSMPFDQAWGYPLAPLEAGEPAGPMADFLKGHYFSPKDPTPGADRSWRRIDGAWLASAAQLALQLDSATNNTSLAMAIELVDTGQVLLFPADAQVGNWLSWFALPAPPDGQGATAADLLARTVFYKVGHHGSHNATLSDQGLLLMPEGLVAFVPVDREMAAKKGWTEMPLPSLVKALQQRCGDGLVCMDIERPEPLRGVTQGGAPIGRFGSLYFDWTLPIAG